MLGWEGSTRSRMWTVSGPRGRRRVENKALLAASESRTLNGSRKESAARNNGYDRDSKMGGNK